MSLLSKSDIFLYEKKDNNLNEYFDLCFIPNPDNSEKIDMINKNIYNFALSLSTTYKNGGFEKDIIVDLAQFNKIILDVYSLK